MDNLALLVFPNSSWKMLALPNRRSRCQKTRKTIKTTVAPGTLDALNSRTGEFGNQELMGERLKFFAAEFSKMSLQICHF